MNMRMNFEFLAPGMQHTEEANSAPRCLGLRAISIRVSALVRNRRS